MEWNGGRGRGGGWSGMVVEGVGGGRVRGGEGVGGGWIGVR